MAQGPKIATKTQPTVRPKVKSSAVSGIGGGLLIAWGWGFFVPEQPMPPEVAAVLGGAIGAVTGPILRLIERIGT